MFRWMHPSQSFHSLILSTCFILNIILDQAAADPLPSIYQGRSGDLAARSDPATREIAHHDALKGLAEDRFPSLDIIAIDPFNNMERYRGWILDEPGKVEAVPPNMVENTRVGSKQVGQGMVRSRKLEATAVEEKKPVGTSKGVAVSGVRTMVRYGGSWNHGRMPKRPAFSPWGGKRDTAAVIALQRSDGGETGSRASRRYLARRPFNSWGGKRSDAGDRDENKM